MSCKFSQLLEIRTKKHLMKQINPYCVLGGAGVCQKTGVLLSAEQRPPPAQLRPGPGAEHVPHSPSAENSAAYSGVTAHERGGWEGLLGIRVIKGCVLRRQRVCFHFHTYVLAGLV